MEAHGLSIRELGANRMRQTSSRDVGDLLRKRVNNIKLHGNYVHIQLVDDDKGHVITMMVDADEIFDERGRPYTMEAFSPSPSR